MKSKVLCSLLTVFVMLSLAGCNENTTESEPLSQVPNETAVTPMVDIKAIADKSEEEVSQILGSPVRSDNTTLSLEDGTKKEAISSFYQDGTNVLFIENKAIWITVYPPEGTIDVKEGPALLGLSSEESGAASSNTNDDYIWSGGLYQLIQAFNDGNGTISYIYIITNLSN
jgi:hypothetical protein